MTTVLDVIQHYQNSIDKSSKDEKRLLHCIEKLYKLPVTVQHLQETGIGKTVNTLRKYDGEVGVAAKALVAKWKAMVAAEESSAAEDDDPKNEAHDEDNSSPNEEDKTQIKRETTNKSFLVHHEQDKHNNNNNNNNNNNHNHNHNSNSSSSSHKHKSSHSVRHDRSDKHKNDREHKSESHSNNESSKERSHHSRHGRDKDKLKDKSSEIKHQNNSNMHASHKTSKVDNEIKIKQEHHSSSKSTNSRDKHKSKPDSSRKPSSTSSPDNISNEQNALKIKREKFSDDSENEYHSSGENTKYREKSMKSIQQNNIKVKEEKITTSSSSNSNHRTKSRDEKTKSSSNSSNSGSTNNNNSNNHSSNEDHNSSRSSSKHKVKDEPVSSHRVSSSSKHKEKVKDDLDKEVKKLSKVNETDIVKPERSIKRERDHDSDKQHSKASTSSSSSVPSSSKKSKTQNNPKEAEEEEDFDGIDCSMGASFADALAMIQKPTPYKSISKKKTTYNNNNSSPSSSSSNAPNMSTPTTSKRVEIVKQIKPISTPSLLTSTAKLEPLDLEIGHELPIITNNYKPMPLNSTIMDCVFSNNNKPQRRQLTDEEAFGASISSKTVRTKVYSGIKTGALNQAPTLFDLCIRILKKNIDALEYTGGVPFEILKPILEGATPQQLFTFEDFNPYLIDDSDSLWQHHCNRRFRGQKLQEFETWRDMFLRCQEEENLKFANLTENIKQSQKLSIPVKHTKLAYVDSMAKPPRSIQKKQNQFGTERKLVATPASRVASLSGVSSNIAKTGDFRLRVVPGSRDTAQANTIGRKKAAPLMLKTLQFMKGHLKR